ncbi:MAG: fused MFS/spermidine synthase [Rhodocyclaceae bacterium]|nr:fused MFS/spermidine synthase [Rhodocyclaceae bacterium]
MISYLTRDERLALGLALAFPLMAGPLWALGFPLPSLQFLARQLTDPAYGRVWLAGLVAAVTGLPYLAWRLSHARGENGTMRPVALLVGLILVVSTALFAGAATDITHGLHPLTLDKVAAALDATYRFPTRGLGLPGAETILALAPAALALGFAVLYGLELRGGRRPPVGTLRLVVLTLVAGALAYHLAPLAGSMAGKVPPAGIPRDAFPFMPLAWALLLRVNAQRQGRLWLGALAAVLLALVSFAALSQGKTYLVALVATVPFALALQSAAMAVTPDGARRRRAVMVLGFGLTLLWALVLRLGPAPLDGIPGLIPVLSLATLGLCAWASGRLSPLGLWDRVQPEAPAHPLERSYLRRMTWMFFVSGFIGLVYEVVFSKQLALVFGGMASATYTVLAVYLGGMALGAWIGGFLASRGWRPLRVYAACEAAIGLYCLTTPFVLILVRETYVHLGAGLQPDDGLLVAARVCLGALALLPPTVLMGITLPVLGSDLERHGMGLGAAVGRLYGANTLGAALGALLAGYLMLPTLGIRWTISLAAAGGLLVALVALTTRTLPGKSSLAEEDHGHDPVGERLRKATFAVLFLVGVVTLVMEVEYMHLLAVVAGNSSYAFSLMLFALLVGLGIGGEWAPRVLHSTVPPAVWLPRIITGLAAMLLAGVFAWNDMPGVFAAYQNYGFKPPFGAREFIRGVVCWLMMFPPAVLIGMAYPLAMNLAGSGKDSETRARRLGSAVAVNTLGNIVGALLAGFILLPFLGAIPSVQVAAGLLVASALLLWWADSRLKAGEVWMVLAGVAGLFAIQPASLDYDRLSKGANVYFASRDWGHVIDHAESLDGGLTLVTNGRIGTENVKILLTNGKFQGNDVMHGEMRAQLGFATAPLLHVRGREAALVIGYGTGVTARTLKEAGFQSLDVVDLSKDIVSLADRHFTRVNDGISRHPGVKTHYTDGRNFLLLTPNSYDLISMEVSSIWFAGAASLYSREFYQLAAKRLKPGGILQQWTQLHHITRQDVAVILASIRTEFPYVWLYVVGDQGVIVASKEAAEPREPEVPEAFKDLLRQTQLTVSEVSHSLTLTPANLDRLLASRGVPLEKLLSTDDNLALEYSTPKGNALDTSESYNDNLGFIEEFAGQGAAGRR